MPLPSDDFSGDASLYESISSDTPVTVVSTPQTQPSFDQAGTPPGSSGSILTAATQLVTTVADTGVSLYNAAAGARTNAAIAAQQRDIAVKQSNTAAAVADYQNKTALAQAQSMYAKAAGLVSSGGGVVLIAGVLGLLALLAWKK